MFSLQCSGTVAQLERALIAERTKAGMKAAKARGKLPGNPGLRERRPEAIRAVAAARDRLFRVITHLRRLAAGWLDGRRLFFPEPGGKHGVCVFNAEVVRVEVFVELFGVFGVVGMAGIGHDGQQFVIAPDAATIFWRTIALSCDADRIGLSLDRRNAFFDCDRVLPIISEVVSVSEAIDAGSRQAVQGQPIFVGDVIDRSPIAKLLAIDVEGMEVAIMQPIAAWMAVCSAPSVIEPGTSSRRQTGGFKPRSVTFRLTTFLLAEVFGALVLATNPFSPLRHWTSHKMSPPFLARCRPLARDGDGPIYLRADRQRPFIEGEADGVDRPD